METGKTGKYLKYAIGEIVLVVIGILIALSINNWNENRKDHIKERELLTNVKNTLTNNIEFIKEDIILQKSRIRSANLVLDAVRNKKAYYDSLSYHIHTAPIFPNPDLSFTAYESLKSTGFDIIRNPVLKNEIMNLFEVTYPSMIRNLSVIENQSVQAGQLSFYLENFERSNNKAIPNNYNELIKNQKFINIIVFHKDMQLWGIQLKEPCLTESERIIKLLDEELNKEHF
jgi:Family of unknown function (DUF6090)